MKNAPIYTRIAALSAAGMLFVSPVLAQQTTQEPTGTTRDSIQPQSDANANADAQTTGPDANANADAQTTGTTRDSIQPQPDANASADAQTTGPNEAGQTAELEGMQVWSSDEQDLGTVKEVNLGPNGQAESIHVNVGAILGIGGKTVKIDAAEFAAKDDRVALTLSAEEVSALPEVAAK